MDKILCGLLWIGVETLITVPFTALVGGLFALWFYRQRIERQHKFNTIVRFKNDHIRVLSEAAVVFSNSKPVVEALRLFWDVAQRPGAEDETKNTLLRKAVEAMYDDVGIKYDVFPVLERFQDRRQENDSRSLQFLFDQFGNTQRRLTNLEVDLRAIKEKD